MSGARATTQQTGYHEVETEDVRLLVQDTGVDPLATSQHRTLLGSH